MNAIKINVYGKLVTVEKTDRGWAVFHPGADGRRRSAGDIIIPDFVEESELEIYLPVPEFNTHFSVQGDEYLVRIRMLMPHKVSLEFDQLEMIIIHLCNDFG